MSPADVGPDDATGRLLPAARTLALDAFAAGVGGALEDAGVRFVLLKGPTVARWLYRSDERSYLDVDLLVRPHDLDQARHVLASRSLELSYLEAMLPHGRRPHAEAWVNPLTGLSVDLHRTLPGVGVEPEAAWTILTGREASIEIEGRSLPQLAEPGRALLIALHAAHHGVKDGQALADLAQALDRVDEQTWREAAELADRLSAARAFSAGLRLLVPGRELADALRVPASPPSVETILRANSAPELALSLDWLIQSRGARARAILVARKLVPPRRVLKARSPLARRGPAGLALAYILQPLDVAARGAPAIRAWLKAREESRRAYRDMDAQPSRRPSRP